MRSIYDTELEHGSHYIMFGDKATSGASSKFSGHLRATS